MDEMADQLRNEDSYAIRRKIFKNIWDAAMELDVVDIKPKVIKTARLDESLKSLTRKKKLRIKNLRTVCKKILEFCDRQDVEDLLLNDVLTTPAVPEKTVKNNPKPIPKVEALDKKVSPSKIVPKKKNVPTNKLVPPIKKVESKSNEIKKLQPLKKSDCVIVARANLKNTKKTSLEVIKNRKKVKTKRKNQPKLNNK